MNTGQPERHDHPDLQTLTHAAPRGRKAGRTAVASMVGGAVENYDFFIYGTASAAYFGETFFHTESAVVGVLASFATLAVGFLFRPLGGFLAGHFGDRLGRKRVLIWSLAAMGVGTVLIGVLPTYAQVGVLAPTLLVLLRVVQGVGLGAEWGGAVLMAVEHAPAHRRGFFGAVPQVGIPAGLLLANGAFLLSETLFTGDWVWRAPFLASIIMVAAGMVIRLKITESPEFREMAERGEIRKTPALDVLRHEWRSVLQVLGLRLAETGGYYVTTSFVLAYVGLASITDKSNVLVGTLIGSALGLISLLAYGALSDRVGRKPIFFIGSIFTIVFGVPMFLLINTGAVLAVVVAVTLSLLFSHDPIFAVEASWFSEKFPRDMRSSGISLGYNGASLVAGTLPFVATALYNSVGWIGAALLFSALGLISTLVALRSPETAPVRLAAAGTAAETADTRASFS